MSFSERIGKKPIKTILQVESIDSDLTNRLWNVVLEDFFEKFEDYTSYNLETEKGQVCKLIWKEFYKEPIDQISQYSNTGNVHTAGFIAIVRKWFFKAEWYEVYDFIEFLAIICKDLRKIGFTIGCNLALEREVAGYRIINENIVQITSETEVQEIEEAISKTGKWKSVNLHLQTALDLLADRKSPNYRNSIKESISAVESLCIIITKDDSATLGKALAEIEKTHSLHKALKTAFSAIYGYTSDSSGIRHALLETDTGVEFEDAKFMLISCSAFVNYLKAKMKI